MIKFDISYKERCDMTGEHISPGKPFFILHRNNIRKSAFPKFIDYLEEAKDCKFETPLSVGINIKIDSISEKSKCEKCKKETSKGIEIITYEDEEITYKTKFCNNCISILINSFSNFYELIDNTFLYSSESGFHIIKIADIHPSIDFITGDSLDKHALSIGFHNRIVTRIDNIEEVVNILRNPDEYDSVSKDYSEGLIKNKCSICQDYKELALSLDDDVNMCIFCRDYLTKELEDYINREYEFISSLAL
jgi:hypothetical protein